MYFRFSADSNKTFYEFLHEKSQLIEDTVIKELANEKLTCFQFDVTPKVENELKVTSFKLNKGISTEHCHFIVAQDRDLLT